MHDAVGAAFGSWALGVFELPKIAQEGPSMGRRSTQCTVGDTGSVVMDLTEKGIKPVANGRLIPNIGRASQIFRFAVVTKGVIFSCIITVIPTTTRCAKGYLVSSSSSSFIFGYSFILNGRSLRK